MNGAMASGSAILCLQGRERKKEERRRRRRKKRKLGLSIFNILYFTKNSWGYAPLSKEA
jgi:hypothetical protein